MNGRAPVHLSRYVADTQAEGVGLHWRSAKGMVGSFAQAKVSHAPHAIPPACEMLLLCRIIFLHFKAWDEGDLALRLPALDEWTIDEVKIPGLGRNWLTQTRGWKSVRQAASLPLVIQSSFLHESSC